MIGHTALVLTPWHNPVPLRRAWCLWEIFSTLGQKAELSVCMSDAEMRHFHRALADDVEPVLASLCTIDAETAEAGSQKDLDMIFAAVRALDGGFQTLNATVLEQMRQWLLDSMTQALEEMGVRFVRKADVYRVSCSRENDSLAATGGPCNDATVGLDQRPGFGNWYRTCPGTKDDASICAAHYNELSLFQKRKWKLVSTVADLGTQAGLFVTKEYALVNELHPGKEADAASLLIGASRLLGEMEAIDSAAWDDFEALSTALDARKQVFGEHDARTAEAMFELANSATSDTSLRPSFTADTRLELLLKSLEISKQQLPPMHKQIGNIFKFIGRSLHEVSHFRCCCCSSVWSRSQQGAQNVPSAVSAPSPISDLALNFATGLRGLRGSAPSLSAGPSDLYTSGPREQEC